MNDIINVAVLVGSLRKDSFNRKTARALVQLAPAPLALELVDIGPLPHYNQDDEEAPPAAWTRFREQIKKSDAFIFVSPEYNRSMPGALKNAIDVGSRPPKQNAWGGKPGAVVTVTPGALGGFGANHHLRQCLMAVNVATMPQPEVYISRAAELFNDQGDLTNDSTRALFEKFMQAYLTWIKHLRPNPST